MKGTRLQDITGLGRSKPSPSARPPPLLGRASNAHVHLSNTSKSDREICAAPRPSVRREVPCRAGSAQLRPISLNTVLGLSVDAQGRTATAKAHPGTGLQSTHEQGFERCRKRQRIGNSGRSVCGGSTGQALSTMKDRESRSLLPPTAIVDCHRQQPQNLSSHEQAPPNEAHTSKRSDDRTARSFASETPLQRKDSISQTMPMEIEVVELEDDEIERPVSKLRFNTTRRKKLLYGEQGGSKQTVEQGRKSPKLSAQQRRSPANHLERVQLPTGSDACPQRATSDTNEILRQSCEPETEKISQSEILPPSLPDSAETRNDTHSERLMRTDNADVPITNSTTHPAVRKGKQEDPARKVAKGSSLAISDHVEPLPVVAQSKIPRQLQSTNNHYSSQTSNSSNRVQFCPQPPPAKSPTKPVHSEPYNMKPSIRPLIPRPNSPKPRAQAILVKSLTDGPITSQIYTNESNHGTLCRSHSAGDASDSVTTGEIVSPSAVVPIDTGPWSRCAFDLFGFRRIDDDIEVNRLKKQVVGMGGSSRGRWMGANDDYDNDY